jgi:hypothetical protein
MLRCRRGQVSGVSIGKCARKGAKTLREHSGFVSGRHEWGGREGELSKRGNRIFAGARAKRIQPMSFSLSRSPCVHLA